MSKTLLCVLTLLLAGCDNLHVHFPAAGKPAPAEAAQ